MPCTNEQDHVTRRSWLQYYSLLPSYRAGYYFPLCDSASWPSPVERQGEVGFAVLGRYLEASNRRDTSEQVSRSRGEIRRRARYPVGGNLPHISMSWNQFSLQMRFCTNACSNRRPCIFFLLPFLQSAYKKSCKIVILNLFLPSFTYEPRSFYFLQPRQ